MTEEEIAEIRGIEQVDVSLADIAIVKSHNYAQEYDPKAGRVFQRGNYAEIKKAYQDGFLAGFAFRMGGGHESG